MFKNQWAHYSYDGIKNSYRFSRESKFEFECSINHNVSDHLCVLKNIALEVYEKNPKLDILFSGGINSQIILKTYKELKIPINVLIFAYEDDINLHWDIAAALKFCKDYDIKYTKINFNLQKFFELEAESYFLNSLNTDVCKLPLLKMIEYCENVPVIGTAYPLITRSNFFYDTPSTWNLRVLESELNLLGYSQKISRPIVANWFLYDQDFLSSLLNNGLIKNLMSDRMPNITSNFTLRSKIYDLKLDRVSQTGMEWEKNDWLYPDFINRFHHSVIKNNINSKMKVIDFNEIYKSNILNPLV